MPPRPTGLIVEALSLPSYCKDADPAVPRPALNANAPASESLESALTEPLLLDVRETKMSRNPPMDTAEASSAKALLNPAGVPLTPTVCDVVKLSMTMAAWLGAAARATSAPNPSVAHDTLVAEIMGDRRDGNGTGALLSSMNEE